jgi:hypothetical protein
MAMVLLGDVVEISQTLPGSSAKYHHVAAGHIGYVASVNGDMALVAIPPAKGQAPYGRCYWIATKYLERISGTY